jgi:hypothetical protein
LGGAGSESSGGNAGDAASGGSGTAIQACKSVDEGLAYGPMGEPWSLPTGAISGSTEDCQTCRGEGDYAAFPTASGYGFVWREALETDAPVPNLLRMTVDSNFEGGEPSRLGDVEGVLDIEVATAPGGFVISTCSADAKPRWLWLDGDLGIAGSPSFAPEDASCGSEAPPIVWTGDRYLTAFTDTRGLVVLSLDAQGAKIDEEIISNEVDVPAVARFAKSGDRTLLIFSDDSGARGRWGVLGSDGKLLGDTQPIGGEDPNQFDWNGLATATENGWLIVSDMRISSNFHPLFTFVSKDGSVLREQRAALGGVVFPEALTRSPSGGSLLVGMRDETGQFGRTFAFVALIDDAGEVVYLRESDYEDESAGPWSDGVVVDPLRDLVVEVRVAEGSESAFVVQEYGCLD